MSYVDENLVPGESIAYRAQLHWVVVAPALIGGTLLDLIGVGLLVAGLMARGHGGQATMPLVFIGMALLLMGSLWVAAGFVRWRATEITVTNRRVFIKTGILNRHTTEILLAKVESVSIEESLSARMGGFGRVTIHGTGGTPEVFERIARPHEFRRQVQIQIESLTSGERSGFRTRPPSAATS